jgi:hypothetical protein
MSVMALPMVAEGRGPYRRADLEHMPDDGRRYEPIDDTELQPDIIVGRRSDFTVDLVR